MLPSPFSHSGEKVGMRGDFLKHQQESLYTNPHPSPQSTLSCWAFTLSLKRARQDDAE